MKVFLIAFITFCSTIAAAQHPIKAGLGIIKVKYDKYPAFAFYADTTSKTPFKSFSIIKNKQGDYSIKNWDKNNWLIPEGLMLDYGLFILRVDTIINGWYHVFVNNDKGVKLWLRVGNNTTFIPWHKFLVTETTGVGMHIGYKLPIKTQATDSSKTIKYIEAEDLFKALEIKGDWMRVKTDT